MLHFHAILVRSHWPSQVQFSLPIKLISISGVQVDNSVLAVSNHLMVRSSFSLYVQLLTRSLEVDIYVVRQIDTRIKTWSQLDVIHMPTTTIIWSHSSRFSKLLHTFWPQHLFRCCYCNLSLLQLCAGTRFGKLYVRILHWCPQYVTCGFQCVLYDTTCLHGQLTCPSQRHKSKRAVGQFVPLTTEFHIVVTVSKFWYTSSGNLPCYLISESGDKTEAKNCLSQSLPDKCNANPCWVINSRHWSTNFWCAPLLFLTTRHAGTVHLAFLIQ